MSDKIVLALEDIRTDGGTQPRADISMETVERYQEAIEGGADFPLMVVFYDGTDYWLADGFHRYRALRAASKSKADVEVKQGTQRDAILFSVGANALHGLPRTNADKRRAVETLLRDEEWTAKSDRWIAEQCAVSHTTVQNMRKELATVASFAPRTGKDGKTRRRPVPTPPAKMSEPLDAAPEQSCAQPAPRPPRWEVKRAMRTIREALRDWPAGEPRDKLRASLRELASEHGSRGAA